MPADRAPGGAPLSAAGLPPGFRHDLLNALNAVIGYASLLHMDLTDEKTREWAARILQAAGHAQSLVESIQPSRSVKAGGRLLLVTACQAGDALELALDRAGWDTVRAQRWEEAEPLLALAPGDVDLVLTDRAIARPDRPLGQPLLVEFTAGEPAETVLERLRAALDGKSGAA